MTHQRNTFLRMRTSLGHKLFFTEKEFGHETKKYPEIYIKIGLEGCFQIDSFVSSG